MLHVLVGRVCNNNCLFCMESDRDARAEHIGKQSSDDIRRMIFEYPNTDEILFTSGEPTLCPELPMYLGWAKERGFSVIGIISNGRRLAYLSFVEQLVDCGLNRVTISIHGHTSKLHDGLTRSPGSFRQARAGLANCARIKQRGDLRVHTSTVITQRNLPHVGAIHAMLQAHRVDETVWNVMMAKGRGARHFETLMPRYGEVVAAFRALCEKLDDEAIRRVRVVDMPPCVMRKLPHGIGGDLEEFDQYEPTGSTGLSGLEVLNPASEPASRPVQHPLRGRARSLSKQLAKGGVAGVIEGGRRRAATALSRLRGAPTSPVTLQAFSDRNQGPHSQTIQAVRRTVSEPSLDDGRPYYVTHRSFKDQFLRAKGPPCKRCSARNSCPGVWEVYVDLFGWDEFEPIPTAHSQPSD